MARPTTYSPVILPVVQACATFGATKDEIANYLGISIRCLYNWQLEHKELVQALKRGEEQSTDRVVETLYQLAIGWKGGKPDLGAICFYLKNKRPRSGVTYRTSQARRTLYRVRSPSDRGRMDRAENEAQDDRCFPGCSHIGQPYSQAVGMIGRSSLGSA